MIKKYKKKPVVIEAIKFTRKNTMKVAEFIGNENFYFVNPIKTKEGYRCSRLEIVTLEGIKIAKLGDYIVKGIQGEFYPCKPDIFKETYEIIENN